MEMDDLAKKELTELHALYEEGEVPPMEALDGRLRGMLLAPAVPGPGAGVAVALARALAQSRAMLWKGKSFRPTSPTTAEGFNLLIALESDHKVAPFHARVATSRHDGQPAVELDYDRPENPLPLRAVVDELRRVGPSLYLGQAWVRLGSSGHLLFYFALGR
ncbi:MAG: hypothetical protein AMXMBFR64_34280 [Myxococcales bacterium]